MSKQYIPGLTPLRGIAALLVIIFHYSLQVATVIPEDVSPVLNKMYLMVDLFFVLSGFVMYHMYGELFRNSISVPGVYKFMGARFARIYPLHLATLILAVIVAIPVLVLQPGNTFLSVVYDITAIPSQLVLTQAMGTHHEATWNTPSWSISVEWWTYLLFPGIVLFFSRNAQWSRWVTGLAILAGYLSIMFYFQPEFWAARWEQFNVPDSVPYPLHTLDVITGSAFLRCLCGFTFGMLVYEGYRAGWIKRLLASPLIFPGTWLLLLFLWHFQWIPDVLAVILFGVIICSAAYNQGTVGRVLNAKPLSFLGDISYSIYLIHMPLLLGFVGLRNILVNPDPLRKIIGFGFPLVESWIGLIVFVLLTVLLAAVAYVCLEKPARDYIKRGLQGRPQEMGA